MGIAPPASEPRGITRSTAFARGAITAATPALLALGQKPLPIGLQVVPAWAVAGGAALAFALAAVVAFRFPRLARLLVWTGTVAAALPAARFLLAAPVLTLLALLLLISVSFIFGQRALARRPVTLSEAAVEAWIARGLAATSTALWFPTVATVGLPAGYTSLALGGTAVLAAAGVLRWALRFGAAHPHRRAVLLASAILVAAPLPFFVGRWGHFFGVLAVLPALALLLLPLAGTPGTQAVDWWGIVLAHPPRLLIVTFAVMCIGGATALALPFSSARAEPLPFIDALFTAVSAVCVTGLIVRDTPVDFTSAGQVIVVLLIQLGGLGIMTFSTATLALLGRRLSLAHEGAVAGLLSAGGRGHVSMAVKQVLLVTAISEAAGAFLLWIQFWRAGEPPWTALGRGIFTAISAFCNAGFALQTDSLIPYASNPAILLTVATLIVLGGLSPFLVLRLPAIGLGRYARAQEKLALAATAILLAAGTFLYAVFEWHTSLAHLGKLDRVINAWFQSVSLRTAGFNSVDVAMVTDPTSSFMLLWMFIGGSPGSTAGGIKTTTAAVIVLAVAAAVRGQPAAHVFKRRIPHSTVYRAIAITLVGAASVGLAFMALILTQKMNSRLALFEVVSALGTVGLSLGATAQLDELGKLIISACMFAGRLGPMTFFLFLSRRSSDGVWRRPEEEIQVG